LPVILSLNKNQDLVIEFRSDSFHQFHGFHIVGRQLPCHPIPPQIPNVLNPYIHPLRSHITPLVPPFSSPGYEPHLLNRPKIIPPLKTSLLNEVPSTSHTPRPQTPYPPPIHRPASIPPAPSVTFSPSTPFSICDLTLTTPQDQFQSMNYPENYGSNLSCELR
jgi:hypothetical protein